MQRRIKLLTILFVTSLLTSSCAQFQRRAQTVERFDVCQPNLPSGGHCWSSDGNVPEYNLNGAAWLKVVCTPQYKDIKIHHEYHHKEEQRLRALAGD